MPPYVPPDPVEADARRQAYVTVAFLALAALLFFLPGSAQEAVGGAIRASVLRPFLGLNELVLAARQRTRDVEVLQARLDSATARLVARSTLEEDNRRLRSLLDLQARGDPRWRAAQVLRPGTQGSESMFLLNLGAQEGLRAWTPVLTREGLGGVIREVRPGTAIGMDWTHPDFGVSAMSRDGAVYGIVETRRGLFREEDRLLLTSAPYNTRLEPGDEIVTSGIGRVYPRGIPIGRVVELAEAQGGWITSYWIQPYVSPGDMVQVLVLISDDPTPLDSLATAGDSIPVLPEVAAAWPAGESGTRTERWERERARVDSLASLRRRVEALQDSIRRLRGGADGGPPAGTEPPGGGS